VDEHWSNGGRAKTALDKAARVLAGQERSGETEGRGPLASWGRFRSRLLLWEEDERSEERWGRAPADHDSTRNQAVTRADSPFGREKCSVVR
jgi:hypothetical protein